MVNQGDKFNSLTYFGKFDIKGHRKYLFICDCGNHTFQPLRKVILGKVTGCGCNQSHYKGIGTLSGRYFSTIKHSAQKRKHVFNLVIDEIWCLYLEQAGKCALSGVDISLTKSHTTTRQTASLDRKDASKGYVIDNVQWVHKDINFMKQSLSNEEFIDWCKRVSKHNGDTDVHSIVIIDVNRSTA